jgi:hypothetical protein
MPTGPPPPPAAYCPPDGKLRDTAVVVEGLGSLSLSPAAMGGTVSEISPPVGAMLPAPVLLLDASLRSDKDEDDEVLALQTPLVSVKGVGSGSVLDTIEMHHVEKVPAEPYGGLLTAALGDKECWVQVGRGGRHCHEPSSSVRKEGLERSLAFKRWARGRCFRCLERGH